MTLAQRFTALLIEPDYATSDLYDSPPLAHSFIFVTAYAALSGFQSLLAIAFATGRVGLGLAAFIGSFMLIVLTWVILVVIFHLAVEFLGGMGELANTAAFVGLAAVPNILTTAVAVVLTLIEAVFLPGDAERIMGKIGLAISLIGMAWGWPGILCYFGLKNAGRLHMVKAMLVAAVVFFAFAMMEILNSNVL